MKKIAIKNFLSFFKSRLFIKHSILLLILVVAVVSATFLWINIYTLHGKQLPVPDFKGKSLEEVTRIIESNELRYEILDSVFTDDVPKGAVYEQNPPAGFNVKRNRRIFFTFNAYGIEKVNMPRLIEGSIVQAKADLKAYGLKIGKLIYVNNWARNLVLKQKYKGIEIKEGILIKKGSVIDLVLGKGEKTDDIEIPVPSLYGLTLDKARDKITNAYLNIDTVKFDSSVKNNTRQKAVVYKQYPWPGHKCYVLGASVNVWLTTDKLKAREEKVRIKREINLQKQENNAEDN